MVVKNWQKIDEHLIKAGYRAVMERRFILPDGREESYEIKKEDDIVVALALTPDNKVLLTKEFRPGPEKIMLDLPGGGIEEGETPEQAMARELLEETGCAGEVKCVGRDYDCAYSSRVRYSFVVINCRKVSDQNGDDNEFIEVVEMSLADFRKHLRSGETTDVQSGYLGLDYLKLL